MTESQLKKLPYGLKQKKELEQQVLSNFIAGRLYCINFNAATLQNDERNYYYESFNSKTNKMVFKAQSGQHYIHLAPLQLLNTKVKEIFEIWN